MNLITKVQVTFIF